MKTKKLLILPLLIIIMLASLTTCENTIINKWWVEEEYGDDPDYYAIVKSVPILIYETIVKEVLVYEYIYETIYVELPPEIRTEYVYIDRPLPPEILLQYIKVVNIEFILFSGDTDKYNEDSATGTSLKPAEKLTNDEIVADMADMLKDPEHLIILHGHANPVSNKPDEIADLERISLNRAKSVEAELMDKYAGTDDLEKRVSTRGYGGGRNISGSSSSTYAGLNRRVEMILIKIETIPSNELTKGFGGN